MDTSTPIAILGAGNMASALALILQPQHIPIRLFCIEPDVCSDVNNHHCNSKYLPGHKFFDHVTSSDSLPETVHDAHIIFVAVPSCAISSIFRKLSSTLAPDTIIANFTKGLDPDTLRPLDQIESSLLNSTDVIYVAIGGPAIATEIARGSITGLVAASASRMAAQHIAHLLSSQTIHVDVSTDMIGVSLCAALKNPYAIAMGLCDGLNLATNTKALVLTRAIEEMTRLVRACGGCTETVMGLAGIGDLFVTGCSPHGRNRTYGERIATSTERSPSVFGLSTVEGIETTRLAIKLTDLHGIHAPLLQSVVDVLNDQTQGAPAFRDYIRRVP